MKSRKILNFPHCVRFRYRCVIEKCGKKFQSRRNLSQHVNKEHKITGNRSVIVNPGDGPVQDQSELDLIALLTVVAEEDLKLAAANESNTVINTGINNQLITVDASAITPVKNNDENSKRRKRRSPKASILKRKKCQKIEVVPSTINMQDLV